MYKSKLANNMSSFKDESPQLPELLVVKPCFGLDMYKLFIHNTLEYPTTILNMVTKRTPLHPTYSRMHLPVSAFFFKIY